LIRDEVNAICFLRVVTRVGDAGLCCHVWGTAFPGICTTSNAVYRRSRSAASWERSSSALKQSLRHSSPMPTNCGSGLKSSSGPAQDGLITIYVATCQVAPFESVQSVGAGSAHITSASLSGPSFRPAKFPARVSLTATVEAIQKFLVSQWMISKSPYLQLPAGEQFYTFKGRILRLDGSLDAYCESSSRPSACPMPPTPLIASTAGRSRQRGHDLSAVRIAGEDLRPVGDVHKRAACGAASEECVRAEAAAGGPGELSGRFLTHRSLGPC
jgi:hypothetical protein